MSPWLTRIETRRRRLRGSCAVAIAPIVADPRHARGGAAAEDADLHAAALVKSVRKLALVAAASASNGSPRKLGEEARRVGDEGRLAGAAAMRHRREEGRIGLDQQAIGGIAFATSCKSRAFLKVTMPEIEM